MAYCQPLFFKRKKDVMVLPFGCYPFCFPPFLFFFSFVIRFTHVSPFFFYFSRSEIRNNEIFFCSFPRHYLLHPSPLRKKEGENVVG